MESTNKEFEVVLASCRTLFAKKLHDYGAAWRILRVSSLTDQLLIKAQRIRSLQEKGVALVDEGQVPEFMGIVNYGLIGLIQLSKKPIAISEGSDVSLDMSEAEALELYDRFTKQVYELMVRKNHDYDEAWRSMRVSSYTDLILMKIFRTKQIEDLQGRTLVSEGIDANYMDMVNYSLFALIKLVCEGEGSSV